MIYKITDYLYRALPHNVRMTSHIEGKTDETGLAIRYVFKWKDKEGNKKEFSYIVTAMEASMMRSSADIADMLISKLMRYVKEEKVKEAKDVK